MTFVFLEGVIILVLVLTGFRTAVFKAVPTSLKTAISVGIGLFIALIGLVDAGFVRRTGAGPGAGRARHRRGARRLADAGLRVRAGPRHRALRPQGQGRDPHLDPRDDGPRDRRGEAREGRPDVRQSRTRPTPRAGTSTCPTLPGCGDDRQRPGVCRTSRTSGRWRSSTTSGASASTLASYDAAAFIAIALLIFTLLLADFFDTMGTMTAIGAEAGPARRRGRSRRGPSRSSSSTRSPRPPAAPRRSPRTPPTSSRRPASARAPAPASRRS